MNLKFITLSEKTRPIIGYEDILILFDTGAQVPVWCSGQEFFEAKFSNVIKQDYRFLLSGFGVSEKEMIADLISGDENRVSRHYVDVYQIPKFSLKDDNNKEFVWYSFDVAVTNRQFAGCDLILPYTMFTGMSISFDQSNSPAVISILCDRREKFVRSKVSWSYEPKQLRYIFSQNDPDLDNPQQEGNSDLKDMDAF